jgi:hypothetical protein
VFVLELGLAAVESVAAGFDSIGLLSAGFESEAAAASPAGFSVDEEPPDDFGA